MRSEIYALVLLGMVLGTYLPRMLPLLLSTDRPLPIWLDRWLKLVPYAALGALILPGILTVDPQRPWVGIVGGLVAALATWKLNSLTITVICAFLAVFLLR